MILDRPRWIQAFWDEEALMVETKSEISGAARRIEDRSILDSDPEWLTIQRLYELSGGVVKQHVQRG
jgi:hypothetical protein